MESQPQNPEFRINPENFPTMGAPANNYNHLRMEATLSHQEASIYFTCTCTGQIFALEFVVVKEHRFF